MVFREQDLFLTPRDQRGTFDNYPMLGVVMVHLQAELGTRAHGDAVELMQFSHVHALISAPRLGHFAMLD